MKYTLYKKDEGIVIEHDVLRQFVYLFFKKILEDAENNGTEAFPNNILKLQKKEGNTVIYDIEGAGVNDKNIKLKGILCTSTIEEIEKLNKETSTARWSENKILMQGKEWYVSNQWRDKLPRDGSKPQTGHLYWHQFEDLVAENYKQYEIQGPSSISKEITLQSSVSKEIRFPMQKIYYGAPGTGKSYGIKENVGVDGNGKMRTDNYIRVTFHPDSDYASFVGCYKPTVDDNNQIVYKFVPQAFAKAYVKAWKNYLAGNGENFYLVIEEINRGNCAQIFGDVFQLLDRNKDGFSEYEIDVDTDLEKYLKEEFRNDDFSSVDEGKNVKLGEFIKSGKKMSLPPTLSLLATMNTSDQSLFPMDSAFKRRWDWKYVPINDEKKDWIIEGIKINEKELYWWNFLEAINKKIEDETKSTDKQMGYYFVKPDKDDKTISRDLFVNKVIFYLWNDVFKRYGGGSVFKDISFIKFYNEKADDTLKVFISNVNPQVKL